MSTRSMTVLTNGTVSIYLYRHCDGYPAYAGKALADALCDPSNGHPSAASVATKLLALKDDGPRPRPTYELADWTPTQQGDLEHIYVARFSRVGRWSVTHFQRPGWGGEVSDNYATWPNEHYDRPAFRAFTEQERADLEARAAAYRARQVQP